MFLTKSPKKGRREFRECAVTGFFCRTVCPVPFFLMPSAAAVGLFLLIACGVVVQGKNSSERMNDMGNIRFASMFAEAPPAGFDTIRHPFPPVYADPKVKKVVPTNSWVSNLFYPSTDNLAPTTPDPYTLRLLDGYGGNPGLTIRHSSKKVKDNVSLQSHSFKAHDGKGIRRVSARQQCAS